MSSCGSIIVPYHKHLIHFELIVFNVTQNKGPLIFFWMSIFFYNCLMNRLSLPQCIYLASLFITNWSHMHWFISWSFFLFLLLKNNTYNKCIHTIIHTVYSYYDLPFHNSSKIPPPSLLSESTPFLSLPRKQISFLRIIIKSDQIELNKPK